MIPLKEKDVQRAITQYLTKKHLFWLRMNTGALVTEAGGKRRMLRFGAKGCADLLVFTRRSVIWIECKRPKAKQTPEQVAWQQLCEKYGHIYIVAHGLEDVMTLFEPPRSA